MAPSSLKRSVCENLPAVSPNLVSLTEVFLSGRTRLDQSDVDATTSSVHHQLESIISIQLHKIFSSLLRHSDGLKANGDKVAS